MESLRKKQVFYCEYCKIFIKSLFDRKPSVGSSSSLLNQKQCGEVSTKKGRSGHGTLFKHY